MIMITDICIMAQKLFVKIKTCNVMLSRKYFYEYINCICARSNDLSKIMIGIVFWKLKYFSAWESKNDFIKSNMRKTSFFPHLVSSVVVKTKNTTHTLLFVIPASIRRKENTSSNARSARTKNARSAMVLW